MLHIHHNSLLSRDCPDSDILGANLYQESINRCRKPHPTIPTSPLIGGEYDKALPLSRNTPQEATLENLEVEEVISILVCTGVYKPGDDMCSAANRGHRDFPNRQQLYHPTHIVNDAEEAIRLVLEKEGYL